MRNPDYIFSVGYDDADASPADYGWVREEDIPNIEHAKDMMDGLIDAVYKTGSLDKLEEFLYELAYCLDIELPREEPLLEKKVPKEKKELEHVSSWEKPYHTPTRKPSQAARY